MALLTWSRLFHCRVKLKDSPVFLLSSAFAAKKFSKCVDSSNTVPFFSNPNSWRHVKKRFKPFKVSLVLKPVDLPIKNDKHLDEVVKLLQNKELFPCDASDSSYQIVHDKKTLLYEDICLKPDPVLNSTLRQDFLQLQENTQYINKLEVRRLLPIASMKDKILDCITKNKVTIILGYTGCGKSTQVPQMLLENELLAGRGSSCRVVCTQPRRISAISVAARVAEERAESLGNSVGYQIRLETVNPRAKGSVIYCTTGVLLQWLHSDPLLQSVSHLVLDEVHERNWQSDMLITIVRDLLHKRPDLKVVLMSATIEADKFSKYFAGAPVLFIEGKTFDVTEHYLEDVLQITRFQYPNEEQKKSKIVQNSRMKFTKAEHCNEFRHFILPWVHQQLAHGMITYRVARELSKASSEILNFDLVLKVLQHICCNEPPGAILVFLPGWQEIGTLHQLVQDDFQLGLLKKLVIPLHSRLPTSNQRDVFERPPPGVRKIILATNIAETSVTIEDIVYVVDCGFENILDYNRDQNMSSLRPQWISKASAKQRAGRAGRVQSGICYHLFSRGRHRLLKGSTKPEAIRMRLEEPILIMKGLQLGFALPFFERFLDPPDFETIEKSLQLMESISAIDEETEELTPLGRHLTDLPMDPLSGRMLLMSSLFSCVDPLLTIASVLALRDPFEVPMGKEDEVNLLKKRLARETFSDHLMYVRLYNLWEKAVREQDHSRFCKKYFISHSVMSEIRELRQHFRKILINRGLVDVDHTDENGRKSFNCNAENQMILRAVITAGFYPNVARIVNRSMHSALQLETATERSLTMHPMSVLSRRRKESKPPAGFVVFRNLFKTTQIYIMEATCISPYPLLLFGKDPFYNCHEQIIEVDELVRIKSTPEVARTFKEIRYSLSEVLELAFEKPWLIRDPNIQKFINVIVNLLSHEGENDS